MLTFFKNNIIAAYITDKDGVAVEIDVLDAAGVSLLNGEAPSPPVLTSEISDVSMTVGDPDLVIDLSQHFSGATSYAATAGALASSTLRVTADAERTVDVKVKATNSAGSVSDTFSLSITDAVTGPVLSSETANGEVSIVANGDVEWTITEPAEYEGGPYTVDRSAEYSGNLNVEYTENTAPQVIVTGAVERVSGASDIAGATYKATPPLWQIASDDVAQYTSEWWLDGVTTGVSADEDYVASGPGTVFAVCSITIPGKEIRHAVSNEIAVSETTSASRFIAPDATKITDFVDASGNTFSTFGFGAHKFEIHNNYLRRIWPSASWYVINRDDVIGADQYAEMTFDVPSVLNASTDWKDYFVGPAVRTSPSTIDVQANPNDMHAYAVVFQDVNTGIALRMIKVTAFENTKTYSMRLAEYLVQAGDYAGGQITVAISAVGSTLKMFVNGAEVATAQDAEFATGNVGIVGQIADAAADYKRNSGIVSFDARSVL